MLNSLQHHTAQVNSCLIAFLRRGSTITDVIGLQHILQLRGFNPGAIDSNFGVRTSSLQISIFSITAAHWQR